MTASSTCSCPCAGSVDPTRVAGFAAGVGATVAWYALPDYVRSRPLRGLVKAGLLGVLGWSMVAQLPEAAELPPYDDEDADCSKSSPWRRGSARRCHGGGPGGAGGCVAGAALGSAMITVGVERWLFRRGEARRAQGTRFAHTRQGLALGGLEAALTALTFVAGAVRERLSKG